MKKQIIKKVYDFTIGFLLEFIKGVQSVILTGSSNKVFLTWIFITWSWLAQKSTGIIIETEAYLLFTAGVIGIKMYGKVNGGTLPRGPNNRGKGLKRDL